MWYSPPATPARMAVGSHRIDAIRAFRTPPLLPRIRVEAARVAVLGPRGTECTTAATLIADELHG